MGIGSRAIPGLGPFIAAGPIVAALAGIGAGGVVGGIAGALVGMGIPEYEANRYEGRIKDGGILLSVHADDRDWKNKAKDILERTGAEDIGTKGEAGADYDESDRPKGTFSSSGKVYEKPYPKSDRIYPRPGEHVPPEDRR